MSLVVDQFHFLRPLWLLVIPVSLLIWYFISRRGDARERWKGIVAPHLLDALLVGEKAGWRFRPINLVVLMLIFGAISLAGPTWERELPPFTEDRAPLVVVLDLSQSMDAIDIQPSRLERAKQKIRDLLELRKGARTALFVYSGFSHMVLPLTDDPSLMELFLSSLSAKLMPTTGKNAADALETVESLLEREEAPGTILFITDGIENKDFPKFVSHSQESTDQVMVLGIGTNRGGPIKVEQDQFLMDDSGRRVTSRMDVEGLKNLRNKADVKVTTVSLDNEDVEWIQNQAQTHLQLVQQQTAEERWIDYGYFLTIPIVLLTALWFRRGWTVRWVR